MHVDAALPEYVPELHDEQAYEAPSSENEPASQLLHVLAPSPEYEPALQFTHVADVVAPLEPEYVPAGHEEQLDALLPPANTENVPELHCRHTALL